MYSFQTCSAETGQISWSNESENFPFPRRNTSSPGLTGLNISQAEQSLQAALYRCSSLSSGSSFFHTDRISGFHDCPWMEGRSRLSEKPDRVRRIYERIVNPNTLSVLDEEFSGVAIALDSCYTTALG